MFTYPITITSTSSAFTLYSGLAALLGTTGATTILGGTTSYDDDSRVIPDIGFNFPFYGTNYRTNIYISSNSYLTFGFGSTLYQNLSTSNPGRGILIDAGDRSYSRVYGIANLNKYTIRFEGGDGTSGTAGSPSRVWETTLYNNGAIQIRTGVGTFNTGISTITKGTGNTGEFLNYTIGTNASIVFLPTATNFTANTNSYYQ